MRLGSLLLLLAGCSDQSLKRFNAEPEVAILAPTADDTVIEGQIVDLRGQASDADDEPASLAAVWYSGEAVLCESAAPDEEGLSACTWTANTAGDAIRLEVLDPEGAAGSASVALNVTPNSAPTAAFVLPTEDRRYYDGSLVEFDGVAGDAEEPLTDLVAEFVSSVDGPLDLPASPEADGHLRGAVLLTQGEHFLTLTVNDSYGKSSTATVIVSVGPPNNVPSCEILAPGEDETGREREELLLEATASDPDVAADLLSAEWSSDKDGSLGVVTPTSAGDIALATTTLSAGTHVLSLTVTDDAGATCVDSVAYTVRGAPVVTIDDPLDGGVLLDSEPAAFAGHATDLESLATDLTVEWVSDVDGTLFADSPDSDGLTAFTAGALTPGPHLITLTAVDPDGQWTAASIAILVDAVPSAPGVALGPAGARTDDDLVVTLPTPSVDPDGDPITYSYEWFADGIPSSASSTATLPASATRKGETWSVTVTPDDGYGPGPSGSAALTVANTAPEISSASIDPASPTTDDELSIVAVTSDADGDSVSLEVAWYVNGALVGMGSRLSDTEIVKGDEVYALVTPNDGTELGTELRTATVTVGNSAPSAATVVIDPSAPAEGVEDLVCEVEASDADGDVLEWSFDWTVDGVAFTTTETTHEPGDTVLASETSAGETWTCTASPSDGVASGASGTDSVSVTACVYGQAGACPGLSCDDILTAGYSTGDGNYWVDPDGAGAIEVYCDMSTDGGGWTLVAVSSDDGADTWTYARRRYWDLDTTTFGSLGALNQDYKSEALHRLPMTDVLLMHQPSALWAAYGGVGGGSATFAAEIAGYGDESCWRGGDGFAMTAGGLSATGDLCDTDLYLNPADKDGGGSCSCSDCDEDAFGPSFSTSVDDGCDLDDPGIGGSLGPSAGASGEGTALGFGSALGLNTGAVGAAENYVHVYVR